MKVSKDLVYLLKNVNYQFAVTQIRVRQILDAVRLHFVDARSYIDIQIFATQKNWYFVSHDTKHL